MADVYFLLEYPIYRDFEGEDIDVLAKICEEIHYVKNEIVFKEGDEGDAMYIIKSGIIKIYKETEERKKLIVTLSDGEFFGEMALIDGSPRSATVIAGEQTEVIKISKEGVKKLKDDYSKTGFKILGAILKFMSYRIRRTTTKAASLIKGKGRKKKKVILKKVKTSTKKRVKTSKK